MVGLLDALLQNESGGRNIPNVHQGTSSGQAQGYFQITTGTWNDFGGTKYAATPLGASYAQQAEIASKIPLKRWDKSTLAAMQATGKPIDPNKTLGENLAASGEDFRTGENYPVTPDTTIAAPSVQTGKKGEEVWSQPKTVARHPPNPQTGTGGYVAPNAPGAPVPPAAAAPVEALSTAADIATLQENDPWAKLATGLASSVQMGAPSGGMSGSSDPGIMPAPDFAPAVTDLPPPPPSTGALGSSAGLPQLADLFKINQNIGQAMALNTDAMGNPLRRRQYG
jgi:hypothetical protein